MKSKAPRKPAELHCPFCGHAVSSWFLRERLDEMAWHINQEHFEVAICLLCYKRPRDQAWHLRVGCSNGLYGKDYQSYTYREILAAWHANVLGVNPHNEKETAK